MHSEPADERPGGVGAGVAEHRALAQVVAPDGDDRTEQQDEDDATVSQRMPDPRSASSAEHDAMRRVHLERPARDASRVRFTKFAVSAIASALSTHRPNGHSRRVPDERDERTSARRENREHADSRAA